MKRARIRETNADGMNLVVDLDKVKTGFVASLTDSAAAVRKMLEAKGVKLSKDEDDALDKHLGVKDGGKLDKVLDAATGVSEGTAEMVEDDDMEEAELDEADVEDMSEKQLRAALKRERKKAESREKAREKAEQEAREAKALEAKTREAAISTNRDRVLSEMNIPEHQRPRLVSEFKMLQLTEDAAMREHVRAYVAANRQPDGGTIPLSEGGQRPTGADTAKSLFAMSDR